MKLLNPTDDQLDAAFAEHVAGYYVKEEFPGTDFPFTAWQGDRRLSHHRWASKEGPLEHIESFTRSFDAVQPWLEKHSPWSADCGGCHGYMLHVFRGFIGFETPYVRVTDKSLPRAACIALLRAHGVEVEFTT